MRCRSALLLLWLVAVSVCQAGGDAERAIRAAVPVGPGELEAQNVVYLGLVDGSVVAWCMHTGAQLWNFTSMGVPGADSHDVVSEFGKPSFQLREGQALVTELGGQGSNYVLDGDGGLFEQPWDARDLLDAPGGTSKVLGREGEEGEDDGVLFTEDKVQDVYGVDPVAEGLSMKYCRLANRPDDSCDAYDDGRESRTLIVTRTTYTMTEQRAGNGEVLWNRSSSFYDMKMSHPGMGGHIGQPWSIVQRAVPADFTSSDQMQWRVDAFDADGTVRFTKLLPARLVASFTLANGQVTRNGFNDCGDVTDAECWDHVANGAFEDRVSVFKHNNAYFALPSVEIARPPLNPLPSPFAPRPSGSSTTMIGDGTAAAMLPDADCDADEVSVAGEPAGSGWGFDGGSTRTDIATGTDSPQSLVLQTDSYRGFWRREESSTTSTSTAIAVFTRQEPVVPIQVGSPTHLVDEVQLVDRDDTSSGDSTASSDTSSEQVNVQDILRAASAHPRKTITVQTPEFLDDIPLNITMSSIVAAVFVVLVVGILIGTKLCGGSEQTPKFCRPGECRKYLRRRLKLGTPDADAPVEAQSDSEPSEPDSDSDSHTGTAMTVPVSRPKRSPKLTGISSPYRSPKGGIALPGPGGSPPIEHLNLSADIAVASSSSSDESSVDGSSDEDDGSPSAPEAALKTSKSEPNLSRSGATKRGKGLHHVDDSSSSSHISSEHSRSQSHSRSPQQNPSIRPPPGGFNLAGAPPAESKSVVSRYEQEFKEIRRLGKGGQGTVFVAHRKLDGIDYAVKKVLLPRREKDRERVLREVKSLAQLEHMNIVRYYNAWIEQIYLEDLEHMLNPPSPQSGLSNSHFSLTSFASSELSASWAGGNESIDPIREVLFIQMKLYAQETLQQYLAPEDDPGKRQSVNEEEVMEILLQILAGLAYVHKEGLIHRDLKPANIFRSKDSGGQTEWKIGDFGLSKSNPPPGTVALALDTPSRGPSRLSELDDDSMRDITLQNTTEVGTALYASPEQSRPDSSDISEKTDMFSIGVILVELFVRFTTWHHRRDELTRARQRRWDEIDDGNFERDLCGLELMARECLHPLPDKRPTAETFYLFTHNLRERKSKEARQRAGSTDASTTGGHGGGPHASLGAGMRSKSGTLGPRQRSGIPAIELQPERFHLHVWGTDEDGTLGTRVQGVVQQAKFAAPDGGKFVRVEKYEQVEGHEQVTLQYVLTNVRPDGGIADIRLELLDVDGVLECKGGPYGEAEAGELGPDEDEPLKIDANDAERAEGRELTGGSDAASAPSAPGRAPSGGA